MIKIDNIIFEKVWEDEAFIEMRITAISKFSTSYQTCYVDESGIKQMIDKINFYLVDSTQSISINFGEKAGDYTPAYSMKLMSTDKRGHLKIEVDIEIEDIDDRSHRCKYFVESELGAVERFGKKALSFYQSQIGTRISMFQRSQKL